jgi:hypothetical protein
MKAPKYALFFALAAGCAAMPSGIAQQSILERFNSKLAEYQRLCASGHYNDASTGCKLLKLSPRNYGGPGMVTVEGQPLPIPQEWVATKEGRFAHSIKLPQPLSADSGYKQGMTPQQYFEHLCAKEAGEFIYRTVPKIEGLYQMRPRSFVGNDLLAHLYAMEDLYGHVTDIQEFGRYVRPLRYRFFETTAEDWSKIPTPQRQIFHPSYFETPKPGQVIERFSGYDGKDRATAKKEFDTAPSSRYGYTWRGVRRPFDRDMGIAAEELIVLDFRSQEVLGVRRGFLLAAPDREPSLSGVLWGVSICPRYDFPGRPGVNKDFDFEYWFIRKVLKPINLTKPEPYLDVKGN